MAWFAGGIWKLTPEFQAMVEHDSFASSDGGFAYCLQHLFSESTVITKKQVIDLFEISDWEREDNEELFTCISNAFDKYYAAKQL
ncbi:hypothetical protein NIE88_18390 [Sporolactobacillus shoreicorticis]|uniref:Uncharacterized protein n=1 Tax=Sporolactobacillus shoreicorticis TaxID=1923877 RepID=A0ABW5S8T8_9BACL|nr:hypothetical protein [Sporolactobacillus shoreicorticis]MCO7127717.1 hypothetical protein [Sporolactobacillus shoreicorticis]